MNSKVQKLLIYTFILHLSVNTADAQTKNTQTVATQEITNIAYEQNELSDISTRSVQTVCNLVVKDTLSVNNLNVSGFTNASLSVGATGPAGATGATGAAGATGATGPAGSGGGLAACIYTTDSIASGATAGDEEKTILGCQATGPAGTTVVGFNAIATGPDRTTAIGYKAQALNRHTTAVGEIANASGQGSTAIGDNAQAGSANATALGRSSQATGSDTTALGNRAQATNAASTAVGRLALANSLNSTAIGASAQALANNSTSLGLSAQATSDNTLAIGAYAAAYGSGSTAVGEYARATFDSSTALGQNAYAYESGATALGQNADAGFLNSTALGQGAIATGPNHIRLGNSSVVDVMTTGTITSLSGDLVAYGNIYALNGGEVFAGAFHATSDMKAKENIANSPLGLAFIKALTPVIYNMKNAPQDRKHLGLLAQDVEKIAQRFGIKNFAGVANVNNKYYLAYDEFIAPMMKAIQELAQENEQLKQDFAARLKAMETYIARMNYVA